MATVTMIPDNVVRLADAYGHAIIDRGNWHNCMGLAGPAALRKCKHCVHIDRCDENREYWELDRIVGDVRDELRAAQGLTF